MEEHKMILDDMLLENYNNILDLGSGRTSMSLLLEKFPNSNITGICYPGDYRKLDRIKEVCKGDYTLLEMDVCKEIPKDKYDLVLCHLLFGEAPKFGNTVEKMANKVFDIDTNNILVVDYLEDPDVNYEKFISIAKNKGFTLTKQSIYEKKEAERYLDFIGRNYIAIYFERN